jgi:hypothetical protein
MDQHVGDDYRQDNVGLQCSSDAAFSVADKWKESLVGHLHTRASVDHLLSSSNNSFQPPSKTTNTRG